MRSLAGRLVALLLCGELARAVPVLDGGVAAAEAENVSRTALKLHVSQPALSRQIHDLEEELGFALFERSAKSVRLTEAGRSFLSESRAVLQRVNEAVSAARAVALPTATVTPGRRTDSVGSKRPLPFSS